MNRNFRHSKANASNRGRASLNGPQNNARGDSSSSNFFNKPLHSSDHGHQQDENPFSHLASVLEMGRPSSNPFDKGIMPSFDDRAIDEDYRKETAKKFGEGIGRARGGDRGNRQPFNQTKVPSNKVLSVPPISHKPPVSDAVTTTRPEKNVKTTVAATPTRPVKNVTTTVAATPDPTPVREPTKIRNIPEILDELDLDDFLPKPPVIMPSTDLKPQINIRSRNVIAPKPAFNPPNHEPVTEPVNKTKPAVQSPVIKHVVKSAERKPPVHPGLLEKPIVNASQTKISINPAAKPIIDYFGTNSSKEKKTEVDQKEEYFKESQMEANKILFGVEEPTRPLTNVEVSKRKKLILKLVDQKLKMKLTELMTQVSQRSKAEKNSYEEHTDNFADQMENLVPDSLPDNPNPESTQNWSTYPSGQAEATEQNWNDFQPDVPNTNYENVWSVVPPMYQPNPGWIEPRAPPGIDQMHIRFPQMPPVQPNWNPHPNPWQPHMRPTQWQHQRNWNMPVRPMNPHLMQPNLNLLFPQDQQLTNATVPPVNQLGSEKAAADIALELKEKEFLERTLMGSKNKSQKEADPKRRRTPEKLRKRERPRGRRFGRDRARDRAVRSRSRDDRHRSSDDQLRDRHSHRSSSNRSAERILHRGALSPSRLSPLITSPHGSFRDRSPSRDHFQEFLFGDGQFDPMNELIPPYTSRSRSRSRDSRSEDLRVRLSQRRNKHHSRSPADLRNKLSDNRQNRNDDLRNQLSDRKRRKRSRSSSRSRGESSKKFTKSESDAVEWTKFNNIVGMLMNIDMDADLSSEEMSERKEIMKLLLENPDLLELDEKFVYKFGKGRLTLAVKEAENILYPNGVPDERIATLISKKISALSTEKKIIVAKDTKDTVPIEWIKLGNIIDQLLHLTIAERAKLSENDRRMIERDELLLKISDDPHLISALGTKYGHRNVEWAIKYAKKILYLSSGVRDKRVDEAIAKERKKAVERIRAIRKSRNSSESQKSKSETDSKSISSEWNELHSHVTRLVQSTLEKFEKMSREDIRRRDDLMVQMSRDPDAIRSNTKFTDNIDKSILNDIIDKCKRIIAGVKASSDKTVGIEFERRRSRLINTLNYYKTPNKCIHDQILARITPIFGRKNEKWTAEEKKERDLLAESLVKDPESLRTNTKAVERIGDKLVIDEIVADIKQMLSQLDPSKSLSPKKFHISSTKVIDIPFVVKIVDASNQLNDTTKTVLLRNLREMIGEIGNPPKPKLLQQRYIDGHVEVVCANLLTYEWLKRAIVSDFKDKWNGANLRIERIPVKNKISRDKLKSVVIVFKDTQATLPFDDIVRCLRKGNSKLYPERWELQDARGENGDYRRKTVGIDIESLAALEQMNRFARLGRSLIYFDISYMGDNVPNFEATCQ